MHGSGTRRAREAAARRLAEADAQVTVRRLLDNPSAPPIDDPVGSLLRLAGRLELALDWAGARVNELESIRYEGRAGVAGEQTRAELTLWITLAKELRGALVDINRLGLEAKRIAVERAQADALVVVIRAVLDLVGLTEQQWAVVDVELPARIAGVAT